MFPCVLKQSVYFILMKCVHSCGMFRNKKCVIVDYTRK